MIECFSEQRSTKKRCAALFVRLRRNAAQAEFAHSVLATFKNNGLKEGGRKITSSGRPNMGSDRYFKAPAACPTLAEAYQ